MAGAFALGPELVARAAVEGDETGFDRLAEGFVVHETDHENAAALIVLDDRGEESFKLAEIEIHSFVLSGLSLNVVTREADLENCAPKKKAR